MEAMLGIFSSKHFFYLKDIHGWIDYPFESILTREEEDGWKWEQIIPTVIERATLTHFLLDRIILPLNPSYSVTCNELQIILDNNLTDKVRFWVNGEMIDTTKVLAIIEKVKDKELTFNEINFDSI